MKDKIFHHQFNPSNSRTNDMQYKVANSFHLGHFFDSDGDVMAHLTRETKDEVHHFHAPEEVHHHKKTPAPVKKDTS
jgi:hypothetical protein